MQIDVRIGEVFLPIITERHEHYAFFSGRGCGKSHGIAECLILRSIAGHERIVCGRQFQVSIKDSVKALLESKVKALGVEKYFYITEREMVCERTDTRFSFIGMERNPESAQSLEGATIFWGEEARKFTQYSLDIIIPTIRAPGSCMIWSWNPKYRDDPIDYLMRGPNPPENAYIRRLHQGHNPHWQDTRMPSEYRRLKDADPLRHSYIWGGEYDENPDAVIFTAKEQGIRDVDPKIEPMFGLDFGYGSDPNFGTKVYVLEDSREIYVAAECVGHRVSNTDLPALIRTMPEADRYEITADSSRPETIDYLNSQGLIVKGARKGAGSVANGINWMQGYRIVVHPSCTATWEEVRSYRWATDKLGRPLPHPKKNQDDHGIDSIRYAVEDYANGSGGAGAVYEL